MQRSVDDFVNDYLEDVRGACNLFDALTDESLSIPVADGHRTLGQVAWHIVQSVPEMLHAAGVKVDTSVVEQPVPSSAAEIAAAYKRVTAEGCQAVRTQWDDAELARERDMYGSPWSGHKVLLCLLGHEAHHRGQMSVLMRQAGLVPYGVYGPHKEAWATMGMQAPAI